MLDFKVVDIEGGDQVGKGDAVLYLAKKYCEYGIDSTVVSLPYYSTPLGCALRKILTDGFEDSLNVDPEEQLDTKMSLFSLNRLEVLNAILSKPQEGVYIFDRGPFSNSLTIAYSLVNNQLDVDVDELVERALNYDSYFRRVLNIDNCVIKLESQEGEWVASRQEKGDLHERSDVQKKSNEIYGCFEEKIGDGWANIVTKDANGWRSREEISKDSFEFVNARLKIYGRRFREKSKVNYMSIEDIASNLYIGSSIKEESKSAWTEGLISNSKQEIYKLSSTISMDILETFKEIKWYNEGIKREVKRITSLNPSVLCVLEGLYGERFLISFLRSIDD